MEACFCFLSYWESWGKKNKQTLQHGVILQNVLGMSRDAQQSIQLLIAKCLHVCQTLCWMLQI